MLVLRRKIGERIVIGGGITIEVQALEDNARVKFAIYAPDHVAIERGEELLGVPNQWVSCAGCPTPMACYNDNKCKDGKQ